MGQRQDVQTIWNNVRKKSSADDDSGNDPSVCSGKGYFEDEDDGSGKITLTVAFTPDENGNVHLSGEKPLEPMVLYALFENEKGE